MATLDLSLTEFIDNIPPEMEEDLTGYTDRRALPILDMFLQSDSTMSLEAAANSVLDLITLSENAGRDRESLNFARLCYEVATNIPWHHPALLRLAWLVERLGWSDKFSELGAIKTAADTWRRSQPLGEVSRDCWDNAQLADPDSPKELQAWVSICAFEANLDALNIFTTQPPFVWMTLDTVFGQPRGQSDYNWHPNAPGVRRPYRDAFLMGAAQWIIWDGQNLYRRALYRPPQGRALSSKAYFDVETSHVTMEKWKSWKQGFQDASGEEGISEGAKELALRAFRVMDVLEASLQPM